MDFHPDRSDFIYGTAAVIMIIALEDLERRPVFLFLGCMAIATMIEWFAGKILERLNQQKWWDYSRKRWNFDGYICLQYSLLWGALGVLAVRYGDSDFTDLFHLIPQPFGDLLIGGAVIGIVVDMSVSSAAALHIGKPAKAAVRWNRSVAVVTRRFTQFYCQPCGTKNGAGLSTDPRGEKGYRKRRALCGRLLFL